MLLNFESRWFETQMKGNRTLGTTFNWKKRKERLRLINLGEINFYRERGTDTVLGGMGERGRKQETMSGLGGVCYHAENTC